MRNAGTRARLGSVAATLVLAGAACLGQEWEVNGLAGGSAHRNLDLTNRFGSAQTGFANGVVFGVSLVQHYYDHISGEIRWTCQRSDLMLASGGAAEKFRGSAHALHYDWHFYARPRKAPLRPFLAAGAGLKNYRGTGVERAYQPLSQFALLTRTTEWKPLISVGGGVKVRLSQRWSLTAELRDYLTPFPREVIVPVGGASLDRWVHDLVPTVGLGIRF
ncbi:MAG: hypothetical protein FJW34_01035 [Acidobacteria bacterium]|nr:hypothetical protein [Acidobacteriota bacterium]